ncbi:MAG: isochorismate synthase [Flavobacteriaceae bacterium]|nr:MAG: isochorismate synthase [Flavobacteriaceae bacterium]
MFSDFLLKINTHFSKGLPFVGYRKPGEEKVTGIFQKDDALHHIKTYTETGFAFSAFDSKTPVLLQIDEKYEAAYQSSKNTNRPTSSTQFLKQEEGKKEDYIDLVQKAIDQINKGTFEKVVLSRKIELASIKGPLELFQTLLNLYPSAFCYLWYHPKVGLWMGATPEILLKTENKRITTMSLAGTKAYVPNESPIWKEKELNEQALVTQYIVNALVGKIEKTNISDRESIQAGNVWHLRSSISGIMKASLKEIVNALHPTPAVCGLPKETSKAFILENEDYKREYYTGFLGELNFTEVKERTSKARNQENKAYKTITTKSRLFVNLRCMKMIDKKVIIYVGGGVTNKSDPEKEWEETVIKSATMGNVIG